MKDGTILEITESLTYRWFNEVWNNNRIEAIDEMLDENVITHGLNIDAQGIDAFKAFHAEFTGEFKDIQIDIELVLSEGEFEVGICSTKAVHKKSGMKVTIPGIVIAKIVNGKVVEAWNNFDFLSLYFQLGKKLT